MNLKAQSKTILIGLPSAGKTTFVIALWHALESGDLEESLRLGNLGLDTTELSRLRDLWLRCEPMPRTTTGFDSLVSLEITEPGSDIIHELHFPDANGEKFQQQWVERHWDEKYEDLVKAADGILLFLNCGKSTYPMTLREMEVVGGILMDEDVKTSEDEVQVASESTEVKQWNPAKAPTQVQMVELLQFVLEARESRSPLRLSVVISAWDLVEKTMKLKSDNIAPECWLSEEMPLLMQFLRANTERLETKVFGLSAQGGDFKDSAEKKRLQNILLPSQRIIVRDGECTDKDISIPVRWVMKLGHFKQQHLETI